MLHRTRLLGLLLLACTVLMIPAAAPAQISVGVAIHIGPPPLPVYEQPICPEAGYMWTPGYWAYGPDGYYWVPGTWVMAPEVGYLWTPGYWGWGGGGYLWHGGYWGPHVGFYGGINYGFGYNGVGFVGGEWRGREFAYNTAVVHVNTTIIHNTYIDRTVIRNNNVNRVSFNGGHGGIDARPNAEQERFDHESHINAVSAQVQHEQAARENPNFRDSVNHGRPAIGGTARPGDFHPNNTAPRPGESNRNVPRPNGDFNRPNNPGAANRNVPRPPNNGAANSYNRSNDARNNDQRGNDQRINNQRANDQRVNDQRNNDQRINDQRNNDQQRANQQRAPDQRSNNLNRGNEDRNNLQRSNAPHPDAARPAQPQREGNPGSAARPAQPSSPHPEAGHEGGHGGDHRDH